MIEPVLKHLGRVEYETALAAMKRFSDAREATTPDEIWFLEHPPVYTLGLSGRREHVLDAGDTPVVHTDRGGQVTYHGPGQLVVYTLLDLRRNGIGIRPLVTRLEQSVIDLLDEFGIEGARRAGAPGVYVNGAKIAALGVRVRRGCCYHGLALNVSMDLAPYRGINPCGYAGLAVTQLADLGVQRDRNAIAHQLAPHLLRNLYAHNVSAVIPGERAKLARPGIQRLSTPA
jgi:lipoyl(octanoyl) transferase